MNVCYGDSLLNTLNLSSYPLRGEVSNAFATFMLGFNSHDGRYLKLTFLHERGECRTSTFPQSGGYDHRGMSRIPHVLAAMFIGR